MAAERPDPSAAKPEPMPQTAARSGSVAREAAGAASEAVVTQVIPEISERLHVEKIVRDLGGYRITKTVQAEVEHVDVALKRHHVGIERVPIQRLVEGEPPTTRHEGNVLVIPVLKEVAVTTTRLMLVEEIRITQADEVFHEPASVELRSERVRIDRLDPA